MTQVDRWCKTTDIWTAQQHATESVDDFIARMQLAAAQVHMPQQYLTDDIIKGLRPELKGPVIQQEAVGIDDVRRIAKAAQTAHRHGRQNQKYLIAVNSPTAQVRRTRTANHQLD